MNFADLIKTGQLTKEVTSKHKIAEFLQFAEEELLAAKFNFNKFPLTAYKSAYDAKFSESKSEVKNSIAQSETLVKKIEEHVKINPLQGRLF